MNPMIYRNPVIRGFYPDPSICSADGKYYLVCSSFQYFPGVPLFESSDLVNWRLIGHVLRRKEQLPLYGADCHGGIYAPTIRYYNGRFYMTATNVTGIGNFYVWTENIYGEWSDPIPVSQGGIDPSFYFENDTAYFMSNHNNENGTASILQCEIDLKTGQKLTDSRCIWNGCGGRYLEATHLYKIGRWYYLMAAEGGTEYGHMVVLARGSSPYGPFENAPANPIVSNRDLGGYLLQGTGHGDLVCDHCGNWWMVLLAFRQSGRYMMYHHLGREVCLIPVTFTKDAWMEAGNDGHVLLDMKVSRRNSADAQILPDKYTFSNTSVGKEWVFIRNPYLENYHPENYHPENYHPENYQRTDSTANADIPSGIYAPLRLHGTDTTLSDPDISPSFLGIRQQEMAAEIQVLVRLTHGEAGISLYMNHDHHYDLAVQKYDGKTAVIKRRVIGDMICLDKEELAFKADKQPLSNADSLSSSVTDGLLLRITASNEHYDFYVDYTQNNCNTTISLNLGSAQTRYLSSEVAGGFTGVMIGLYAVDTKNSWAEFEQFCYKPIAPI